MVQNLLLTWVLLYPSDIVIVIPKWDWCDCSKVRVVKLSLSDIGTIVLKWHWYSCSQVRLAQLFSSETGTIVLKWHWHNCFRVRLARLFPSGSGLYNLYFVLQFVLWHDSSLVSFTCEELCHAPGLRQIKCYQWLNNIHYEKNTGWVEGDFCFVSFSVCDISFLFFFYISSFACFIF